MESKKKFKLRYIVIPLVGTVLLFLGYVVFSEGFMLENYEIAFFGKTYSELYSFQTQKEKKVGEEIVERARACMEYNGEEQLAPQSDNLACYYYFPYHDRPACTEIEINLVKCVIHGEEGSVWFRYSLERFDENDKCIHGALDVLTRCTIEKADSGEWIVTNVSEPP